MEQAKFSFQAFLITLMIFSGILFFFTVSLSGMSDIRAVNESYRIENTDYYVRYASHIESGIYDSDEADAKLLIKGNYGHDWAAVCEGGFIYCNEYRRSSFGFMTSDVVKISTDGFSKEILFKDTMLNGRNVSGQLILFEGVVMPDWFSDTNPLADLYGFASGKRIYKQKKALVCLYDPSKGKIVYHAEDENALAEERSFYYRNSTLEEVQG